MKKPSRRIIGFGSSQVIFQAVFAASDQHMSIAKQSRSMTFSVVGEGGIGERERIVRWIKEFRRRERSRVSASRDQEHVSILEKRRGVLIPRNLHVT